MPDRPTVSLSSSSSRLGCSGAELRQQVARDQQLGEARHLLVCLLGTFEGCLSEAAPSLWRPSRRWSTLQSASSNRWCSQRGATGGNGPPAPLRRAAKVALVEQIGRLIGDKLQN